jgi:hypothetical protein
LNDPSETLVGDGLDFASLLEGYGITKAVLFKKHRLFKPPIGRLAESYQWLATFRPCMNGYKKGLYPFPQVSSAAD